MKKRLQLKDFKVRSFITGQEQIQGGTGSLPTGGICEKTQDCGWTSRTNCR